MWSLLCFMNCKLHIQLQYIKYFMHVLLINCNTLILIMLMFCFLSVSGLWKLRKEKSCQNWFSVSGCGLSFPADWNNLPRSPKWVSQRDVHFTFHVIMWYHIIMFGCCFIFPYCNIETIERNQLLAVNSELIEKTEQLKANNTKLTYEREKLCRELCGK